MIYIYATILSVALMFFSECIRKNERLRCYRICSAYFAALSFLPLALVSGFRYYVGTDYGAYESMFRYGVSDGIEPGFELFVNLLKGIFDNPQSFFFFSSIWICGLLFVAAYKHSAHPFYTVLLFVITKVYFVSMNAVRQMMAASIILLGMKYIRERKLLAYTAVVLVAASIHRSAAFLIVLYFLYSFKTSFKKYVMLGAFSVVFGRYIVAGLVWAIKKYTSYGRYFSSNYNTGDASFGFILIFACMFALMVYIYEKNREDNIVRYVLNIVALCLIISMFSGSFPENFTRIIWSLMIVVIVYLPYCTGKIPSSIIRIAGNFSVVAAFSVYTIQMISNGNQEVLPYVFCWQR